ncbi:MAG: hypothetical protein JXM73_04645 [Anaerolineae bacterium]|nr:hypothetical protein [Anaerolineae bacterium]
MEEAPVLHSTIQADHLISRYQVEPRLAIDLRTRLLAGEALELDEVASRILRQDHLLFLVCHELHIQKITRESGEEVVLDESYVQKETTLLVTWTFSPAKSARAMAGLLQDIAEKKRQIADLQTANRAQSSALREVRAWFGDSPTDDSPYAQEVRRLAQLLDETLSDEEAAYMRILEVIAGHAVALHFAQGPEQVLHRFASLEQALQPLGVQEYRRLRALLARLPEPGAINPEEIRQSLGGHS